MSDRRAGRHAFDASAVTDVRDTPQLREGRRETRNGVLVLVVSSAPLVAGLVVGLLHLIPDQSGWRPLISVAIIGGGVFTSQGIRMIRAGRATLRDEIRRQQGEATP